jgi:serine/threonine-protein kinase
MSNERLKLLLLYLGIGFGIILVVSFVTSQIFMPLFFGRAKTIEVPNVSNMLTERAKTILTDKKLHAVVRDSTWSDEAERGYVLSQKPRAGTYIKPDGTVYLEVSRGSKYVAVPELVGLDVQSAWIVLKNQNLRFVVADSVFSDLYPVNTVVQSSPAEGERVERRTRIKLYISRGSSARPDSLDNDYIDYF